MYKLDLGEERGTRSLLDDKSDKGLSNNDV